MFKKNKNLSQQATLFLFTVLMFFSRLLNAQENVDILSFGVQQSEQMHRLQAKDSQVIKGGLNQPARVMFPKQPIGFEGGSIAFKMAVDPEKQNYFSVKLWGSDRDKSMILLFSEGKQVGYRHLGDIDLLWLGNGMPAFNDRFFYVTLPIPIQQTKGKTNIELELRSYGEIWGYGENFEKYQKNMAEPSLGFYRAYTHTGTMIAPGREEIQGSPVAEPEIRKGPGEEVLIELKDRVNKELAAILKLQRPVNQHEIMFLAPAYEVKWTVAYHNKELIVKVMEGMDAHYRKFLNDPSLLYSDKAIYNGDWLVTGPIARGIRELWRELSPVVDQTFDDGKGNMVTHRKAWSILMKEAVTYNSTHRRQYTNQSMIIDMFLYDCNEALLLLEPSLAIPRTKALRYLHESVGLLPWLGKETAHGPERILGDNYLQLTKKGLTKELGYVGYYGEVLDWVVDMYKTTGKPGVPNSGDPEIKKQLIKMMMARSYFRYPSIYAEEYKAMRVEAVVGWRDSGHYPGDVIYGDRGMAWDATPLMTAAATLDPAAIGIAQQMIADNQFFKMVADKMKLKGIRVTKSLLNIPDEYVLIRDQEKQKFSLPMSDGMPDFIFSDEEDGVIAIKNGTERLYASLYWRARNAVNRLAKVHYITPIIDRISNVYINSEYQPSGMEYTRPNWVNLAFMGNREWYTGITSAHEGEVLPIAKIPKDIKFKPGDENVYAGKASFYTMEYGQYLIAMNTTNDKNFELTIPASFKNAMDLKTKKKISAHTIKVSPLSTVVYYKN
ncbi:hypothetical protein LPB86_05295 [Pedobacter sp. MC2016-14]|uniref:hypothetical protein n=1 Tax=Pedobacter sp. MC2016-14 TaxID=2897327 RepID=UPI001E60C687|nr:hypothetical protein [Pedobacter sp. MC2016-14]MCD0487632.1 hypothetical protein [Pedobacter sp. MC2016-14]